MPSTKRRKQQVMEKKSRQQLPALIPVTIPASPMEIGIRASNMASCRISITRSNPASCVLRRLRSLTADRSKTNAMEGKDMRHAILGVAGKQPKN